MSQRGFTLIEMTFVVVLIGLIVSGGLFAFAPMLEKSRINQTNAALDQVESALELFVIRNSRLPCPADGSTTSGANYGIEQGGGAAGICTVLPANAVIPWRTLGMDEAYSTDAWASRLSYWPSGLAGNGTSVTSVSFLVRSGATYPTGTFLTVTDVVNSQPVTPTASTADEAAYVLVSHGKSRWYGWTKNGNQFLPTFAVPNKACNNAPASCALAAESFASGGPIGPYPPSTGPYFDDIVRWRSPPMIIQLCGSGSCGNP